MKRIFSLIALPFLILSSCGGSTISNANTAGITFDAPVADIEGAGTDRAKLCGTVADAPSGSLLRIVNRNGSDTNTIQVSLNHSGFFNVMVPGGTDAQYFLTLLDSDGNTISETSGALPRGPRVQDNDQDCTGLQSNLFDGTASINPETSSDLPTPVVTIEPKNFESAQLCGTIHNAPSGSFIRFTTHFSEGSITATNTFDVSIANDGTFSGIVIGDDTTFFTAVVHNSSGQAISGATNFALGKSLAPEDLTCPTTTNVDVDPGNE